MPPAYGSRYSDSAIALEKVNSKDRKVIVSGKQTSYTFSYTTHQVEDWERIDTIANQFYGDSTQWWMIADANPEILDWHDLVAGIIIRIPNP